jgi:hypothetical protein
MILEKILRALSNGSDLRCGGSVMLAQNVVEPELVPEREILQAEICDLPVSAFMVKFCFLLAENFCRVLLRPVSMRVRSTFEKFRTSKSCLVPAVPG